MTDSALIEYLNGVLKDRYGLFENGQPNFRIVLSDDQFEYRRGQYPKFDEHGNFLGMEDEVLYVPKYRQWMPHMWVLERLTPVPETTEELTTKLSYEPLFPYMDNDFKPTEPTLNATLFIVDTLLANSNKGFVQKYVDPQADEADHKIAKEKQLARIEQLEKELFGNETKVGDHLAHETGISMTETHFSKVKE